MPPSPPTSPAALGAPMDPPEIIVADQHRVWCDGGDGALGHPRIYLEMGEAHFVECPYCDRRFVLAGRRHRETERLDPGDYDADDTPEA